MITDDGTDGQYLAGGIITAAAVAVLSYWQYIRDGKYLTFVFIYLGLIVGFTLLFRIGSLIWQLWIDSAKNMFSRVARWISYTLVLSFIVVIMIYAFVSRGM